LRRRYAIDTESVWCVYIVLNYTPLSLIYIHIYVYINCFSYIYVYTFIKRVSPQIAATLRDKYGERMVRIYSFKLYTSLSLICIHIYVYINSYSYIYVYTFIKRVSPQIAATLRDKYGERMVRFYIYNYSHIYLIYTYIHM